MAVNPLPLPLDKPPSTSAAISSDASAFQQESGLEQTHPLPVKGTEYDGGSHAEDRQQDSGKEEDEGVVEDSWTAKDDMLLLDGGGAYQSDEEEGQEMAANPTSVTATDPGLSKVLPDRFVQADKPVVLSPPPYSQIAGLTPLSLHPLPSAPSQPSVITPPIISPQGSYRPNLPPAPVQQMSHHLPPSYAQVQSVGKAVLRTGTV